MQKAATVKIGPEIDKKLYVNLSKVAKENGQSVRFVLERAMENYLQFVAPSQSAVRPAARAHFRRSTDKNRKLHELLAKS
jgi:sigma54-dependent transcription regulator